jgi:hypothetical protein
LRAELQIRSKLFKRDAYSITGGKVDGQLVGLLRCLWRSGVEL